MDLHGCKWDAFLPDAAYLRGMPEELLEELLLEELGASSSFLEGGPVWEDWTPGDLHSSLCSDLNGGQDVERLTEVEVPPPCTLALGLMLAEVEHPVVVGPCTPLIGMQQARNCPFASSPQTVTVPPAARHHPLDSRVALLVGTDAMGCAVHPHSQVSSAWPLSPSGTLAPPVTGGSGWDVANLAPFACGVQLCCTGSGCRPGALWPSSSEEAGSSSHITPMVDRTSVTNGVGRPAQGNPFPGSSALNVVSTAATNAALNSMQRVCSVTGPMVGSSCQDTSSEQYAVGVPLPTTPGTSSQPHRVAVKVKVEAGEEEPVLATTTNVGKKRSHQDVAAHVTASAKGTKRPRFRLRCWNCGLLSTPQWRGGPDGPRTLCNACGVRYKKGLPLAYKEAEAQQQQQQQACPITSAADGEATQEQLEIMGSALGAGDP